MKKKCDVIRSLCNSYFCYTKHIFSTLDKCYWVDSNNHNIYEEYQFPVCNKQSSEEAMLCLSWDSNNFHPQGIIYIFPG